MPMQLKVVANKDFESLRGAQKFAAKYPRGLYVRQIEKKGSRWYHVLILEAPAKANPRRRRNTDTTGWPTKADIEKKIKQARSTGSIRTLARIQQWAHDWGEYEVSGVVHQRMKQHGLSQSEMERYWTKRKKRNAAPQRSKRPPNWGYTAAGQWYGNRSSAARHAQDVAARTGRRVLVHGPVGQLIVHPDGTVESKTAKKVRSYAGRLPNPHLQEIHLGFHTKGDALKVLTAMRRKYRAKFSGSVPIQQHNSTYWHLWVNLSGSGFSASEFSSAAASLVRREMGGTLSKEYL